MPRIGGPGGGPLVPPQTPGTQQTQDANKPDFAGKVAQAETTSQGAPPARAAQPKPTAQQQLIGKTREIAKRLAKGSIDHKEATREFVSLVIEERLPHFKRKKKDDERDEDEDEEGGEGEKKKSPEEQLEAAVTELIDRDPALSKRLQTQLKKLATKG